MPIGVIFELSNDLFNYFVRLNEDLTINFFFLLKKKIRRQIIRNEHDVEPTYASVNLIWIVYIFKLIRFVVCKTYTV